MLTMTKRLALMAATVLGLAFGSTTAVRAFEPIDNTPPWAVGPGTPTHTNTTTYVAKDTANWGPRADQTISTSTDVDYLVATCAKSALAANGTINSLSIDFTHASGDLDIVVYDVLGSELGRSTGVGNSETVSLSALKTSAAVIKVYGYLGAQNTYGVTISCQ
jgi:hypothetical protein